MPPGALRPAWAGSHGRIVLTSLHTDNCLYAAHTFLTECQALCTNVGHIGMSGKVRGGLSNRSCVVSAATDQLTDWRGGHAWNAVSSSAPQPGKPKVHPAPSESTPPPDGLPPSTRPTPDPGPLARGPLAWTPAPPPREVGAGPG